MKKTLIALAVAASAVVSGSAMAWAPNGSGGNVELGGTLTPQTKVTPWEVKIGASVNDIGGFIQKGTSEAEIALNKQIPLLAIRNAYVFKGQPGIKPFIDFGGALDVNGFSNNISTLTLNVKGDTGKIGVLKTNIYAAALLKATYPGGSGPIVNYMAASGNGAFKGGLPATKGGVTMSNAYEKMAEIFPDIWQNEQPGKSVRWDIIDNEKFEDGKTNYSASYAAGILNHSKIQIKLDAPAAADAIAWTASLPISVSYH
ncbi:hypothetical protein ACSI87_003331 [Salmonella enterica subsp. enterica serovar Brandenburg]|nr:hypothetical protein [Salmonella enterica subsp. enterica serovar Nima]EDS7029725.1 hypothetical protein [Salmonella enterica subsp. enterica]EIR7526266.1 hypothetical protein [Salmonella enterica subsp. enterica serovar Brandenburg]EBX3165324.1 hypothetical protein [Salmonella enterica subsp. enterica serovar Nima]ECD6552552.1 hypothetical protein [Salmonella enterica subsp. enterica serovar Nima]